MHIGYEYVQRVSFVLLLASRSLLSQAPHSGLNVTCDAECVIAVDGRFAASPPAAKAGTIPLSAGRHTVMAADSAETYWEQGTTVAEEQLAPLAIDFDTARKEREAAKKKLAALEEEVSEKESNLQNIQQQNEILQANPRLIQELRESIVRQMRRDADRRAWETPQAVNKSKRADRMTMYAMLDNLANQGKGDFGTLIKQTGNIALTTAANRLLSQAGRHKLASEAAARRLDWLADTVRDPIPATGNLQRPDYTAMVHTLPSGHGNVQLALSDEVIEYRTLSRQKE